MIETIGIIGYGSFGRFLHSLAQKHLPESAVRVFARKVTPDGLTFFSFEEVCKSDVVVLAVPIASFAEVLEQVLPHVRPHTILLDISTVKKHTVDLLRSKGEHCHWLATHPMFGPYSYAKKGNTLDGLRIVLAGHTLPQEKYEAVQHFLKSVGLIILELSPETHDTMLAETLFLTHYIAQIVTEGGFERTHIDTISFGYLMDAVESVRADTALFHDVFKFNPYCARVLTAVATAQKRVNEELKKE